MPRRLVVSRNLPVARRGLGRSTTGFDQGTRHALRQVIARDGIAPMSPPSGQQAREKNKATTIRAFAVGDDAPRAGL
ncbi:hypothetical protein JCM24511_01254 [Saitozyma sp. JCM 24511]|nr:hypothetical protein JCM24511_01254 [Saitozyma sp. JCM 24511]